MTDFENFHHDLIELLKKYEHDVPLKVEKKIFNMI